MADLAHLPWKLRYEYAARAASRWRRFTVRATHRHADVQIDPSAYLGPRFSLMVPGPSHLRVGKGCEFRRDFYVEIHGDGLVDLGPYTTFTGSAAVQISTTLTTGSRCVFGIGTFIADGNHRFRDHRLHLLDQGYDFTPITVGDGAIVMSKCTIIAPIGKGAVIGANSVVTKPVPDYCLAVGAPARVVEYFGPPELAPEGVKITSESIDR
jgi:acetyltransferase-like isoleucine patch superfamily enzyme